VCKNLGFSKYVFDGLTQSIALRVPGNECIKKVIEATKTKFLVGTSANLSRYPSSNKFNQLDSELVSRCDAVIHDERLKLKEQSSTTKTGGESTIIDLTDEQNPRIIRQGIVPKDKIIEVLKIAS
jgi:L-threonylcarbamoyladenylate synthase